MDPREDFMRRAIAAARRGIETGQTPFGACIVRDGQVVADAHNQVWATTDITAHAEIVCLRQACRQLGAVDLSGCDVYSTCEPCPMCFAAIHWSNARRILYGASIADAEAAGFRELPVSNERMKALGGAPVEIVSGVLADECRALFDRWRRRPGARTY